MDIKQKLRRWIKETGTVQNHLAAVAKIESGNMSRIVNGSQTPKAVDVFHLSRVMGVSMDWLCDPETNWPPVYLNADTKSLTKAEAKILSLAHDVSRKDSDPGQLSTALDRLMGLPSEGTMMHEIHMTARQPPATDDQTTKPKSRKIS